MIYVALLRGINVGGNARVEMPRLKTLFESLGCTDVLTYINSGNVIFRDDMPADQLAPRIEHLIAQTFGFDVRVILRDLPGMEALNKSIPTEWANDTEQKTDVIFLWKDVDEPAILDKISTKPDIEDVRYLPGAILWHIAPRSNATRSSVAKLVQNPAYKYMTVRNVNTARKLYALMQTLQK